MDQPQAEPLIERLIQIMKTNGTLHTAAVEQAFRAVPRHLFLPHEPLERVYADIAIAVKVGEAGQWTSSSSQPSMMAIMLEQLELRPGMHILEIGAGSGYNAALMAYLVGPSGHVTTIDIQPDLIEAARARLDAAGFSHVTTLAADGGYGDAQHAPFDRIILTVAAQVISPAWREQLTQGGRLVLPLDLGLNAQKDITFERSGDELISRSIADCGFMALQGAFAPKTPEVVLLGEDQAITSHGLEPLPVEPQRLSTWLELPAQDWPTGVSARMGELFSGLLPWLILHPGAWANWHTPAGKDENTGALVDEERIPNLFAFGGERPSINTIAFFAGDSCAALARPPSVAVPFINFNAPEGEAPSDEQPFDVTVRQLGPLPTAARDLVALVQHWDQLNRPGTARMHIRAVPAGAAAQAAQLAADEFLLEKPYTHLIIRFDPA